LRHTHEAFYYQRRDVAEREVNLPESMSAVLGPKPEPTGRFAAALDLNDTSWVGAIQRASERIVGLSRAPRSVPSRAGSDAPPPAAGGTPSDLGPVVELLRQERFAEAMDLLFALPTSSKGDPDAQLLKAALLTNSGRLREAEEVCGQILSADELSAGAHYLLALCREHAGDRAGALDHDQTATYLDAGFAMPHLHLGLLARRGGHHDHARVELGRALALLAREDASRVLLFGGGFSREALIALCRSELQASGGVS
jgi:chemotaxis protein methyltransferase CheR